MFALGFGSGAGGLGGVTTGKRSEGAPGAAVGSSVSGLQLQKRYFACVASSLSLARIGPNGPSLCCSWLNPST